jgi:hypothetical protein
MAESGNNCLECGRPIALFSELAVNGNAYHTDCWDNGRRFIPQARPATGPDQARPSGSGHRDQPYDRPRVMPAVEPLQLGNTRAA